MDIRKLLRSSLLGILLVPYGIFGLGAASNQLVLIANHDKFPVMENSAFAKRLQLEEAVEVAKLEILLENAKTDTLAIELQSKIYAIKIKEDSGMLDGTHCIMTPATHLNFLADIFDFGSIYSIGDFLIIIGTWIMGWTPFVWGALVIKKLYDKE
jgi:hypothetical protein